MLKKVFVWTAIVVLLAGAALWLRGRLLRCRPLELTVIDDPAQLDELHLDLPQLDATSWIRQYNPKKSYAGFNLGFYERRVPIVFDMQGRIVHSWPLVRATGRVRLDREGRLTVVGTDNLVKRYDWDGELIWFFQLPDAHNFPHHDVMLMENGNTMILAHDGHSHLDYLYEVNGDGDLVWEWWYENHERALPAWEDGNTDPTHTNSIRELPPNRWFSDGDERFRPGNLLLSSRSLNTIFIIDKSSGDVVWQYSKDLDHQHEAVMVPEGNNGDGLIMVFNNGRDSLYTSRRTLVQAVNPVDGTVEWEYGSKYFYSTIAGTAQLLPDNNVLITSSHGGRAFEIRPRGRIVWEWVPPFKPMRVQRLPLDHCPQLAELIPETVSEVIPADPRPFVDADLYRFALPEEVERRTVADLERKVAPENQACRQLLFPPDAILRVQYGIDRDLKRPEWLEGRFRLWIEGGGMNRKLVDAHLGSGVDTWHRSRTPIDLGDLAYRTMKMCISAKVVDGDPDAVDQLVWGNPFIESTSQVPPGPLQAKRISEQEKKLQEQQLKALGYVD
ncbi:MAG: arylsulfotransferase family protein [Acidobacteriota bacterium]|nr:arylsulfotransferase family protein [Acidobacteriota bacterium]